MNRTITVKLTETGIDRAIREVERFKRDVLGATNSLCEMLVEEGVSDAKIQLYSFEPIAVYTGQLEDSIQGYYDQERHVGFIFTDCFYAAFVEYGTGIVGQSLPHPNPEGWTYDINNHGLNGWIYFNDRDGKFHWTKGFKSRPFMYNTAQELRRVIGQLVQIAFRT